MMGSRAGIVAYVEKKVLGAGGLRDGEKLLVAVSGGQDSVAMMLALAEVRAKLNIGLSIGHVNHGLRGAESDEDEQFVRDLTARLELPLMLERVAAGGQDVAEGRSSEEAARQARFGALRAMVERADLDRIALGHTATDRAETVLMNILRGSGLEGLAPMPAAAGDLARPMLSLTRDETAAYCAARGVVPRHDSTNLDQRILRNRVRLTLLPLLEREYQSGARQALLRLADIVEGELEWTRPLARRELERAARRGPGKLALDLGALAHMSQGLRRRVLREAAGEVRGDLRDLGLEHLRALSVLITEGSTGQRAELPGLWAERTAEQIVLRPGARRDASSFEVALTVPGTARVADAGLEISCCVLSLAECDPAARGPWRAHLDADVTGSELVIRSPMPGDRMAPLGMTGTKKVHDFLVDKKIPRSEREGIPVVATTEGEIVWLVGHRISERAKVTDATERVAEFVARRLT